MTPLGVFTLYVSSIFMLYTSSVFTLYTSSVLHYTPLVLLHFTPLVFLHYFLSLFGRNIWIYFVFENQTLWIFWVFCFLLSVSILNSQLNYKTREHVFTSVRWECGLSNKISTIFICFIKIHEFT